LSLSFTVPVPLKHRSHESISNNAGNSARAFLWILLALTLVRGILYAIFNPPFGSPDETEHFKYVAYLATGGAAGPIGAEQHQPVPYYALMVPAYWLTASYPDVLQNLAIRIASLPLLLGIVAFTWLAAREMAPNKPLIAVVATAFVALHPENTVIAASANNDTAANFMAAVIVFVVVSLMVGDVTVKKVAFTALSLGLALFTKGQILSTVVISSIVLLGCVIFRSNSKMRRLLIALALLGLLSTLALNTVSGQIMMSRAQSALSILVNWPDAIKATIQLGVVKVFTYQYVSFWSAFLGESIHMPLIVYLVPTAIVGLSAVGYFSTLIKLSNWRSLTIDRRVLVRIVLVSLMTAQVLLVLLRYIETCYYAPSYAWRTQVLQGRFLLASLVPLGLLVAEGLQFLIPENRRTLISGILIGVFVAFDAASILTLASFYFWPN
jgi:hypothetical protein